MASLFLAGLTGGAAANNINVIIHGMGRTIVRCTDRVTTSYSARSVMSRTSLTEYTATAPFTIKNS